jgi:integrase
MAFLRKIDASPYFVACFRDADGVLRNKSTKQKNRGKAQEVANELERQSRNGSLTMAAIMKSGRQLIARLGQADAEPTIEEEFFFFLKLGDRSDNTKERYGQITKEFLEHLGKGKKRLLTSLTAGEVEEFKIKQLSKGLAGKSINIKLKMIRSALSRAERAGRIERNPAALVDNVKEQPAGREDLTPAQITALLRACVGFKKEKGGNWHGLVMLCYYTGCRLSDAANLRAGDVHLDGQPAPFIQYTEKKKRNSPKVRKTLHADLVDYLISRPSGDDPEAFLFPKLANRGTGGAHGLSGEFVALMDAAGIERRVIRERTENGGRRIYNLSEHSLRHACVSQLQEAGVEESLRMQIVGHEDKEVHRNYSHARNKAAAAVQSLPSVLPVEAPAPDEEAKGKGGKAGDAKAPGSKGGKVKAGQRKEKGQKA